MSVTQQQAREALMIADQRRPMYDLSYKTLKQFIDQHPDTQGEPVAFVDESDEGLFVELIPDRDVRCGDKLYRAPPSDFGLREALSKLATYDVVSGEGIQPDTAYPSIDGNWISVAELRALLAAHPENRNG
jgi:hypothetical protein